jgi:hypothetical protein
VPTLSVGFTGLPQELTSAFGQLWIHEHELGREGANEGLMIDETNKPQIFRTTPCGGDPLTQ